MAKRTNILDFPLDEILLGIRKNDRVMLGRAITLIESRHPQVHSFVQVQLETFLGVSHGELERPSHYVRQQGMISSS